VGNPDLAAAALQGELRAGSPGGRPSGAPDARPVHVLQYASPNDPYLVLLRRYVPPGRAPRILALRPGSTLAALDVLGILREGGIVAVKGDRVVDGRNAEVPFLGGRIRVPTGPYLLAALAGVPVVPLACFKEGVRTCRVVAGEPWTPVLRGRATRDEDLAASARTFAAHLEAWARRWPLQWYNFHDLWERTG
jgi:predicted LPLAT superfamily acyltransferase